MAGGRAGQRIARSTHEPQYRVLKQASNLVDTLDFQPGGGFTMKNTVQTNDDRGRGVTGSPRYAECAGTNLNQPVPQRSHR